MRSRPYSVAMSNGFGCRAKRLDLAGREVQTERRQAARLDEQAPGVGVVDLVVARRLVHERRLVGVARRRSDRRGVAVESQVAVQAVGQLASAARVTSASSCRASTPYDTTLSAASSRPNTIVEIAASRVRSVSVTTGVSVEHVADAADGVDQRRGRTPCRSCCAAS